MRFSVKKLAILTMPTMVMFAAAACGGSSSSSSPSPNFDSSAPSKVQTSTGNTVSPGGLTSPSTELPSKSGKLIVQIMDEQLGTRGGSIKTSGTAVDLNEYSAHRWPGGCSADIGTSADWNDQTLTPVEQNEYGLVFEFEVSDPNADGCAGFILRDKELNKVYDGDQMLKWTADDHEISIATNKAESRLSRQEAFDDMYAQADFDTTDASAHWVSKNIIVWKNGGDLHARLQFKTDGIIEPVDGQLNGEFINLEKTTLPDEIAKQNYNIQDYQAYRIPDNASFDPKKILKGEALVVGLDDSNNVKKAARIQTAMVIDDLFADRAVQVEDLGTTIGTGSVTFKLWAPTAQSVKIHVWPNAGDGDFDVDVGGVMTYDEETGVWVFTSSDVNAEGKAAYQFEVSVYHPATRKIENLWVTDPYSLSLLKGNSAVVDLDSPISKPTGWDSLEAPHSQKTASDISSMIITESHIRDLTVGTDKGVSDEHQGKYLGLTETNSNVGKHLKKLSDAGVTHMELLPMYDIASINAEDVINGNVADEFISGAEFCERLGLTSTDYINVCGDTTRSVYEILAEESKDDTTDEAKVSNFLNDYVKDKDAFNWGYDPVHYQVPEGSYASSIDDPYARIREIRQMVSSIKNDYGMNVILDVVYNHTDGAGVEKESSVLDKIVPWYYNRLNPETGNVLADTCCSDSASEHKMFAKLMEDTLVTWAQDYKIDSFRFDLMGYIPKQVMVDTLANVKTRTNNDEMYFFGEGWDAGSASNVVGGENNATQINMHDTLIGTFNDRIRDAVRGSGPFDHGDSIIKLQGFATGRCTEMNDKRKELDPGYSCDASATNDSDYGMHPLNWQDVIRISMAGNLRDYELLTYTDEVKAGKDISYWGAIAGYGDSPINTINYVSKHDNQAVFDLIMYKAEKNNTMKNKAKMQGIAIATAMFGQSPVFDQQGSDLLRTKYFQNDSYNTGDFSNKVNYADDEGNEFIPGAIVNKSKDESDWGAIKEVAEYNSDVGAELKAKMADTYRAFATIRKEHNLLYLGDAELIKENVKFLNVGSSQVPGLIVMKVTKPEGYQSTDNELYVMLNAAPETREFNAGNVEGASALDTGILYADACDITDGKLSAGPWSVCVFAK